MIHGHSRRASRSSLGRAAMADGLNLGGANLTILNRAEGLTQMLASVVSATVNVTGQAEPAAPSAAGCTARNFSTLSRSIAAKSIPSLFRSVA
jgi:hypothetical protein